MQRFFVRSGAPLARRSAKASLASSSLRFQQRCVATFVDRHVGPEEKDAKDMLAVAGFKSMDDFMDSTIPQGIRSGGVELEGVPFEGATEVDAINELREIASCNNPGTNYIGMGFYGTHTPTVILRNLLENPGWYTAYTPYQAEISQGRLEMLLNFQTMVSDLTGMPLTNCSLLDEASSAAEAMNVCSGSFRGKRPKFFIGSDSHPQSIACVQTRANACGIEVVVGDAADLIGASDLDTYCGVMVQYPNTSGVINRIDELSAELKKNKTKLVVATDLLACTVIRPPGEFGADVVIGSSQRFGVPMFYGGPHAAFMSVTEDLKRLMPGRLIGVSKDSQGNPALRMALQTREQFIKREKATSNICTAQALLANAAAAFGIYHGPEGLKSIAEEVHAKTTMFVSMAEQYGYTRVGGDSAFFDTVVLAPPGGGSAAPIVVGLENAGKNVRSFTDDASKFGVSIDETTTWDDIADLAESLKELSTGEGFTFEDYESMEIVAPRGFGEFERTSEYMTHPVFHSHRSETQMLRYLASLQEKDVSLRESMIPLGSCTMKLNATSEMIPISWPEFSNVHPFTPQSQCEGYLEMIEQLNGWLTAITGFDAASTQPNSGATGEYAGLLCIKGFHESNGEGHRNVCLIPMSAHGTNPASATMCDMKVVGVKTDKQGNVDIADLEAKAKKHADNLAALMITYPSTFGVFEEKIMEINQIVHDNGGQVYMDGANMNAQIGFCSPGSLGADVCHLNLHKTFTIPHGGGGPGVGTIGCRAHLAPFLPGHAVQPSSGEGENVVAKTTGQLAAAPFGSAGILPIPWMYIRMMGAEGLKKATENAILNANYMATRLSEHYDVLYKGANGQCAHEFIVDFRPFKEASGISEDDVAKRLADYGFHAPTMSWPVPGTIMIEPTESEDRKELDRLVDALVSIRSEIQDIIDGKLPKDDNPLKNAPHTVHMVTSSEWSHPYSRETAAFPVKTLRGRKIWPTVGRVDNTWGDRNLMCSCPTVEELMENDLD